MALLELLKLLTRQGDHHQYDSDTNTDNEQQQQQEHQHQEQLQQMMVLPQEQIAGEQQMILQQGLLWDGSTYIMQQQQHDRQSLITASPPVPNNFPYSTISNVNNQFVSNNSSLHVSNVMNNFPTFWGDDLISQQPVHINLFNHNIHCTFTPPIDPINNSSASISTFSTNSSYSSSPTNTSDGISATTTPPMIQSMPEKRKNKIGKNRKMPTTLGELQVLNTTSSAIQRANTTSSSSISNSTSSSTTIGGVASSTTDVERTLSSSTSTMDVQFIHFNNSDMMKRYNNNNSESSQVKQKRKRGRPKKTYPEPASSFEFVQEDGHSSKR